MEATPADEVTPWEQRDRVGAFRGLFRTLTGAAFSPATFFARLRPETGWVDAFWYGWLLQAVVGAVGALLSLVPLLAMTGGALPRLAHLGAYLIVPLLPVALYPLAVTALAIVAHLLAWISGDLHRGLGVTLRAVCYSGAAVGLVLSVGPLGLWGLLVGVYALAGLQQMRLGKAAFALVGAEVLLAALVLVPLALFLARHLP